MGALQHELETVVHEHFLAEGFDYSTTAYCYPASAPLEYNCNVDATNVRRGHHVGWTEGVDCRPTRRSGAPRCTSASGWALL